MNVYTTGMNTWLTRHWFFRDAGPILKIFQIYILGDSLVIVPLLLIMSFVGIFDRNMMLITFFLFLTFRQLGEMFYWILHQFSSKTYRPHDFGLTALDNQAIYVMYQLLALAGATIAGSLTAWLMVLRLTP